MYLQFSDFLLGEGTCHQWLVLCHLDVDVDSFSGATSTATDDEVLAVPLLHNFDEVIDQEAEFVALSKKKNEETEASKAKPKPKPKPKKQVITAPSDTADKGTLSPPHVVIEIDPSEYTAGLASKTREMVIAIENPDPNLEIKIDQCRPVIRTKEEAHSLLFLLLFGFHCLFSQSGRG